MNAIDKNRALAHTFGQRYGQPMSLGEAAVLRRAAMTLHRWAELECGDGNDYASWGIERDDETGKPFMARYPHTGSATKTRIPDREAGALKRVAALCAWCGWYFYHQTDPRGAALYVSTEPLTGSNYTQGVAV